MSVILGIVWCSRLARDTVYRLTSIMFRNQCDACKSIVLSLTLCSYRAAIESRLFEYLVSEPWIWSSSGFVSWSGLLLRMRHKLTRSISKMRCNSGVAFGLFKLECLVVSRYTSLNRGLDLLRERASKAAWRRISIVGSHLFVIPLFARILPVQCPIRLLSFSSQRPSPLYPSPSSIH